MTTGTAFAEALAAKDPAALRAVLADDLDCKALTPRRFWEASSAGELVDEVILGTWFGPTDDIEALEAVETSEVGGRQRVAYRLRVANPEGRFLVEQQAYYDTDDDRISWLRILCAGY
ncbi:MAG TPA: hypothetical protein VMU09_07625, partial [Acidimicrobiales bacterium]|nr:hypothetical protein [Acidimicrobiales bacterium]